MINNISKVGHHNISFGSLNNPVKPFTTMTKTGLVTFQEIDYKKGLTPHALEELGGFFLDKFASTSSHPFWKFCKKGSPSFDRQIYESYRNEELMDAIKSKLNDPDATLMVGFDRLKNIVGAIFTNKLDVNFQNGKKGEYLYIDLLAVDEKSRGLNIGKQLLNNVISASKDRFKKSFVVAYKESVPFYKKQGFEGLKLNTVEGKKLESLFAPDRADYPVYASFLEKNLV